jgi:hypothetical protein
MMKKKYPKRAFSRLFIIHSQLKDSVIISPGRAGAPAKGG